MSYIPRFHDAELGARLVPGKVLVLYGPRRSGKTTLLKRFLADFKGRTYYGIGEDRAVSDILGSKDLNRIVGSFRGYDLIVIDEAQAVPGLGLGLKLLVDQLPEARVIASGSSSLELAGQIGEPLTGRRRELTLYPLAALELAAWQGPMAVEGRLEEALIYGAYPDVLNATNTGDKQEALRELRDSYLFKDILTLEQVRNPRKLHDLLTLLAFQIGSEVSLSELGNSLGLAKQTVERYLDLLEKVFVIRRVGGFSRNLRSEVTKTARYYFFDTGIRNAVIANFNPPERRNDMGALWENYLVAERIKKLAYTRMNCRSHFWRTYTQQEIDWVEEIDGALHGYEFKWCHKAARPPRLWTETYPTAGFTCVGRNNYLEFVL